MRLYSHPHILKIQMPILKRDDGIQFAIHAYRELLPPAKMSILRQEIQNLALSHGEYVCLFKLPNGQTEAVFSRDPGFLLGEAIWQHFGKPNDLIYCEALPEGHFAIIVVVRGGSVYLDTKIPFANLHDELASLVTGVNQYDIYIYGDVPISSKKERGKFTFDPAQVKSFTILQQPVFKTLPVDDSLQLKPLEFALRFQKIVNKTPLIIIGVIALLLLAGWWYLHQRSKAPPPQATPQVNVDPYFAYRSALRSPAPQKQIAELSSLVTILYGLPGWQATGVTFTGSNYTIQLNSLGGTVEFLNRWVRTRNMSMTLTSQGVTLAYPSNLPNRAAPNAIYPLQQVIYVIIDKVDNVMPQRSVVLGSTVALPYYQSATLTIQVNNVSPSVLTLIGRQLINLPVKITAAQLAINQGLLTGSISLTAFGN